MNDFYKDKTVQDVLAAAYNKLYYDFRHELIKDWLNNEICFNSGEVPCNIISSSGGVDIEINISKNGDQYSPFEYEVSIAYKDEKGEYNQIFNEQYFAENYFYAVVDSIRLLQIQ